MTDQFHQSLSTIVKILKSSPLSITIQNIQRLSNIYKFETFIESVNDKLQRLSIAGKILVIDIDYEEIPTSRSSKDQTFFLLKDVKLVLANNNNNFKYHNSKTNQNILMNSLTKYEKLGEFDRNLEKLCLFDQYTSDDFDIYSYHIKIYEGLSWDLGQDNVELNDSDHFNIKVYEDFILTLVNDEIITLQGLEYNKSQGKWLDDKHTKNNDIGINLTSSKSSMVIPKRFLVQKEILFELDSSSTSAKDVILLNTNELYRSKTHSTLTLQGFQFLESEIVQVSSITSGDISKLVYIIKMIKVFEEVIAFIELFKRHFKRVGENRLDVDEDEEILFQQFLSQGEHKDNEMSVEKNHINVTLTNEALELKSSLSPFNQKIEYEDPQFISKLREIGTLFNREDLLS